jgi:heme O synthase-like polyprenyltransferase
MFKQYLQVTKPGIIFGNLISVIGGFLLASKGHIDYPLFIWTLLGVSLVVASGCVFNNYIDRDIDRKMERTKNRVLVKGLISPEASLVYATLLGIAGFMLLWFGANPGLLAGGDGVRGLCRRLQPVHEAPLRLRHADWFSLRRCAAGDWLLRGYR